MPSAKVTWACRSSADAVRGQPAGPREDLGLQQRPDARPVRLDHRREVLPQPVGDPFGVGAGRQPRRRGGQQRELVVEVRERAGRQRGEEVGDVSGPRRHQRQQVGEPAGAHPGRPRQVDRVRAGVAQHPQAGDRLPQG
ncbi:hypothetical protein [Dactylosporangium darangshiense]|uniref:hypothetical protein n=1 Tax=Dactylosporangium darangshiense TaxID=579108 RepID=UPI003629E206